MVWVVRTCLGFAEVLVLGQPLACPAALPSRYAQRASKVGEFSGQEVILVQSAAFELPLLLNATSLRLNGLWIVPADARPAGGIPEDGVQDLVRVFGLELLPSEHELRQVCALASSGSPPDCVLYHGTSLDAWAGIQQHGLMASKGMLGTGVYLGSFWKATRFAARTQDYTLRRQGEACIARVYCFCPQLQDWSEKATSYECACEECTSARLRGGAALERSTFTDHESRWAFDASCSGVFMPTRKSSIDANLWIVRNAEWCVRPACCRVQNAAKLDMGSVVQERYEPTQRSQSIL